MKLNIDKSELNVPTKICCIYKLTNTVNGKIYIGQTTDFRKRMNVYKNISKQKMITGKGPITLAIDKYGHENFTADILKRCNADELAKYENYYIKTLDSANPSIGYNITINNSSTANDSISRMNKSIAHIGLKESSDTKRKKSNMIIAIKPEKKLILICESGKIFADYVGTTKDMVKNCLRQPSICRGWRVYYDDYKKRQIIRDKMMKKRSIRNKGYIKTLDMLDKFEKEGVETIYTVFDIYKLDYDYIDDDGTPIPQYISNGASAYYDI